VAGRFCPEGGDGTECDRAAACGTGTTYNAEAGKCEVDYDQCMGDLGAFNGCA